MHDRGEAGKDQRCQILQADHLGLTRLDPADRIFHKVCPVFQLTGAEPLYIPLAEKVGQLCLIQFAQ